MDVAICMKQRSAAKCASNESGYRISMRNGMLRKMDMVHKIYDDGDNNDRV